MPPSWQHIEVGRRGEALVLTVLAKELTQYELAEALGRELVEAVEGEGSNSVIVDLGKLAFLSSVGFGPFLGLHSRLKDRGGRVVLVNLTDLVRQVFEATRLLISPRSPRSPFTFAATVEDAVALLTPDS
jgi:anti-anti-sigma factor